MTIKGKRILLVEDDRFLRRACEGGLRQRGFTVLTAPDGEEGLERLLEAQGVKSQAEGLDSFHGRIAACLGFHHQPG